MVAYTNPALLLPPLHFMFLKIVKHITINIFYNLYPLTNNKLIVLSFNIHIIDIISITVLQFYEFDNVLNFSSISIFICFYIAVYYVEMISLSLTSSC